MKYNNKKKRLLLAPSKVSGVYPEVINVASDE